MSEGLKDLLEQIAKRGIFVINLFQTQQKFDDIRQKHWRCNLMDEATSTIFECGVGPTMESALSAAIEKTHHTPIARIKETPKFIGKKPEEIKPTSLEDML